MMQFLPLKKNPIFGASLLLAVSQLAPLCFSFLNDNENMMKDQCKRQKNV